MEQEAKSRSSTIAEIYQSVKGKLYGYLSSTTIVEVNLAFTVS